jgi:hypothetical protein
MRYIFLIYSQETTEPLTAEETESVHRGHAAVIEDAARKGVLLGLERLKPTATATSVRVEGGKALLTDGPFAETKEQLAGFYVLECANLDEAMEWAARIPTTCRGGSGCIEIRPVDDLPRRG